MCDVLNNKELIILRNKFLSCVPVNDIGLEGYLSSISWEDQAILINQTIKNDLLNKFPINFSYQRAFLKSVIGILEKNCLEIHHIWYDRYCAILSLDNTDQFYYKHYLVNDKVITLKENKNFISEGTTGLCSWQASLALSQWCLHNKTKLENKTILELGSGVGLVGLTLIQHCQPKEVNLSDCHPSVLSVLAQNVSLNSSAGGTTVLETSGTGEDSSGFVVSRGNSIKTVGRSVSIENCGLDFLLSTVVNNTKVNVLNLPWEYVYDIQCCQQINPDYILAADVVYDNSVFGPLCGAVKYFLDRDSGVQVIFACTARNTETLQEFLELLEQNNFKITKIETPEPKDFFWSTAVPIRFYLVTSY